MLIRELIDFITIYLEITRFHLPQERAKLNVYLHSWHSVVTVCQHQLAILKLKSYKLNCWKKQIQVQELMATKLSAKIERHCHFNLYQSTKNR